MAINTIMNNTEQIFELWDVSNCLAVLSPGQAVHNIPITITSVTLGGVSHHNRQGGFQSGDSYDATIFIQSSPEITGIRFTGNQGIVTFT